MANLHTLEDGALLESLRALEARHRETMASIIEHLVELERRRLALSLGYPSLYEYCTRALGLSEDEAYRRIAVARMAAQQPAILAGLADGSLNLSGLVALAPHFRRAGAEITAEGPAATAAELLDLARHQSRREIERRLAARFPQADAPEIVRRERGKIDPLSPGRYRVQVTITQATRDKLERALELMSHQNPAHALAPVFAEALEALVEKLERAKRAKLATKAPPDEAARARTSQREVKPRCAPSSGVRRAARLANAVPPANPPHPFDERQLDLWETAPRAAAPAPARVNSGAPPRPEPPQPEPPRPPAKPPSRHIPRQLRRATFERAAEDGGAGVGESCCFVAEDGRRCGSRHFLEIDHRTPWALEPRHRAGNLRVLCRAHNQLIAEELMGPGQHANTARPR